MSKRKRQHYNQLPDLLKRYADIHILDLEVYSPYHMRLMDGG